LTFIIGLVLNVLKSRTRPIWLNSIEIPQINQLLVVEHYFDFFPSSIPNQAMVVLYWTLIVLFQGYRSFSLEKS